MEYNFTATLSNGKTHKLELKNRDFSWYTDISIEQEESRRRTNKTKTDAMKTGEVIEANFGNRTLYLIKHKNGELYPIERTGGSTKDQADKLIKALGYSGKASGNS